MCIRFVDTVGIVKLTEAADARKLAEKIKKKGGKDLVAIKDNLVDDVWGKDKPQRPNEPVNVLSLDYAGKEIGKKLEDLRKELEKKKCEGFLVCMNAIFLAQVAL